MKPPEFLRVLPADVGRVGVLGACILATVRYTTALAGHANGRRVIDDQVWWRASHDDFVEAMGGGSVSRRTVCTAVGKLVESGDLAAIPTRDFFGDRAQAYRVPDQPLAEIDTGSDQPLAESADRIGEIGQGAWRNRPSCLAKSANLPSLEELEESFGEKKALTRGDTIDPPSILELDVGSADVEPRPTKTPKFPPEFVEFWSVYPRREKKLAALAAWTKALSKNEDVTPQQIIDGAKRYAEDPNRDEGFTSHPSTWLNAGSWDDEALPSRSRRNSRNTKGIKW